MGHEENKHRQGRILGALPVPPRKNRQLPAWMTIRAYYYCFGCHAKGNHFSFMQEIDNINFMQSVEKLAGIAGVPMPANTPEAKEKYDRAQTLLDIMEQAVNFFKLQLKTNAGAAARTYIEQRGLTDDTITAFDIGFAPTGKALFQHLRDKNHAHTDIIACGLAIQPDDQPNDRTLALIGFATALCSRFATARGGV